jgi:hypothetical protein
MESYFYYAGHPAFFLAKFPIIGYIRSGGVIPVRQAEERCLL